jgi:VIT1/CCC1 family predicted Fe2+/Mn2+ transporter
MVKTKVPVEHHKSDRIGWLRASVLGANDGIISTASLILGVTASNASHQSILMTGFAGLVAGSMSMASGEYVSVSSQADNERAELDRERNELASDFEFEHEELARIYTERGVTPTLAKQVAEQLMKHDALGAHARDELGITDNQRAKPAQAAMASATSFAVGASLPLVIALVSPLKLLIFSVPIGSLVSLILLGGLAARAGGAQVGKSALRVGFWGAFAMAVTTGIGSVFGSIL